MMPVPSRAHVKSAAGSGSGFRAAGCRLRFAAGLEGRRVIAVCSGLWLSLEVVDRFEFFCRGQFMM